MYWGTNAGLIRRYLVFGSYIAGFIVYLAGSLRICNLGSEFLIFIIKVLVVIIFIVTICLDYS